MDGDEEQQLRSVALQNANAVLTARLQAQEELVRAKEELQRQSEWFRITLSSIGDAVIATDAEGCVTFMNGVAERLTGWPHAEAIGRPLPEVFHIVNEHTRLPVENPAIRALREGLIVGLANHTVLIARDGTERLIDDSGAPMRDGGPDVRGAVLVFRDVTDRKRADEARARLAAIVESSDDAIVSKSLDSIIRSWNAGAERLFGYTAAEAVGRPITLIIPPDRQDEELEIISRLRRGERIEHFETVRVAKDGRLLDISLTISPIRDPEGRIIGASKVARDITDRKRAEEQTREAAAANAKFRTLFEQGAQFAGILSPDGTVVEANRLCLDACGFTRAEVIGKPFWECGWWNRSPEVKEVIRAGCEQAARGRLFRAESRYFVADGGERVVDVVIAPVVDGAGRVLFLSPTGVDITERKRTEQALRESEARLALAVEIARMGAFETDLATDAVVVNEPGRAIFGWPSRNTTFAQVQSHFLPEDHDEVMRRVGEALDPAGGGEFELEQRVRRADGAVRWLRVRARASFEGAGPERRAVRLLGTFLDVTERREMEEALRESDRKKDEFIALLAHELRNPLAPVRNGLEVIRLSEDRAVRERSQQMMDRQLTHMVRMVDDLLDVSRIGRNKMELRRTRLRLSEVVANAVETARPVIDPARHQLEVALPSEPVTLDADLTRLAQVFSNLLTNSAKYTPPGGRIRLAAALRGDSVVVEVSDTGIGIPREALPKIFDMFSQVDRSFERAGGGLGIGLALVKGLVEMHGGTVSAASEGPGRGSTFTVTLPLAAESPESAPAAPDSDSLKVGPRRRVLVVDDNADGADSMAEMLGLLGDEVRTAHDGLEALAAAEEFRPEVILMDVGMPRLNGLDATRRIREQPWGKKVVIIALTGWGQEGDRERSHEAGCNGHLVKPVNLADLQKLLNALSMS